MHVARFATDHTFIDFNFAGQLSAMLARHLPDDYAIELVRVKGLEPKRGLALPAFVVKRRYAGQSLQ
jgi:hypothetical protein